MPSWLLRYFWHMRDNGEWISSVSNGSNWFGNNQDPFVLPCTETFAWQYVPCRSTAGIFLGSDFLSSVFFFFLVLNLLSLLEHGTVGFQDLMVVKIFTVELFKFSSMTEDMHFNNLIFLVQLADFSALSCVAEK